MRSSYYWGYIKYNAAGFGVGIPTYIAVMFGAHAIWGLGGSALAGICLTTLVIVATLAMWLTWYFTDRNA